MADNFNTLDNKAPAQPNQLVQQTDEKKNADGENFIATEIVTGLANGAAQDWLITVGAQPISSLATTNVEGKAKVDFFEATTVSANGTPITIVDSNRVTANTPLTVIYSGPTVTSPGTKLAESLLQSGEKQRAITSTAQGDRFTLKENTNYLIRTTNQSGGAIDLDVAIDFNEPA